MNRSTEFAITSTRYDTGPGVGWKAEDEAWDAIRVRTESTLHLALPVAANQQLTQLVRSSAFLWAPGEVPCILETIHLVRSSLGNDLLETEVVAARA